MAPKTYITHAIVLLILFMLSSCSKDSITCDQDEEFCEYVAVRNFEGTGLLIDNYLASNYTENVEEYLNSLVDWIDCKSCVDTAFIICNLCVYTAPAQSELGIDFYVNGEILQMVLDISMSDTLKFNRYHERK